MSKLCCSFVESSPRAVSLELDDSKKKFPKLKGADGDIESLCPLIPAQPVNYIRARRKENGTKPTYHRMSRPSSGTPGTGTST